MEGAAYSIVPVSRSSPYHARLLFQGAQQCSCLKWSPMLIAFVVLGYSIRKKIQPTTTHGHLLALVRKKIDTNQYTYSSHHFKNELRTTLAPPLSPPLWFMGLEIGELNYENRCPWNRVCSRRRGFNRPLDSSSLGSGSITFGMGLILLAEVEDGAVGVCGHPGLYHP